MGDLTFGEQVKIMLSRKGMTIKELAENIQEQTGKAMSRQNLTQRLGRDNFQEKDMRMIASILGCPFQLSIFPEEVMDDQETLKYREEVMSNLAHASKKKKAKEENQEAGYQQEFVIDDTMGVSVPEHEMTIGEVYEIHEELSEMEEEKKAAEEAAAESVEELTAEVAEQPAEEVIEESTEEEAEEIVEAVEETEVVEEAEAVEEAEVVEEAEPVEEVEEAEAIEEVGVVEEDKPVEEVKSVEEVKPAEAKKEEKKEKKDLFKTGFLRKLNMGSGKKHTEQETDAEVHEEKKSTVSAKTQRFEPVIQHKDEVEDLQKGELNPYTGREYQSNSVRMHPSRIGYVQVYDRKRHGWTDMTEWAFLGYQERMKALLGKDYEPPIYLD